MSALTREDLDAICRGTVVMVALDPTEGHEINKTRPAVVVSADRFNKSWSTLVVVPITSLKTDSKVYMTEVRIAAREGGLPLESKALPMQIRTVDRTARVTGIMGRLSQGTMTELDSKLRLVLGLVPGV